MAKTNYLVWLVNIIPHSTPLWNRARSQRNNDLGLYSACPIFHICPTAQCNIEVPFATIQIETSDAHCKHKVGRRACSESTVGRIDFVAYGLLRNYDLFSEGAEDETGEYDDKENSKNDGDGSPHERSILVLVLVASKVGVGEKIWILNQPFYDAHNK